jgi:thiamine-monophosphate kinase
MLNAWGARASDVGDDAAIVRLPRGDALIVSVDSTVEGQHFQTGWLSPREIGYRAVAAALSDLAAMAARPVGVLTAIALPNAWRDHLDEVAAGIGDATDAAHTVILGGNLTAATELSISTTVLGAAFAPLERSGATVGDLVYVTGKLGGPAFAIRQLYRGESPGDARERFARPVPRIVEARWLAEQGATAAIDVSDGLIADLRHLAAASSVAIEIDGRSVPCFAGVTAAQAIGGGEEYELVVTARRELDTVAFEDRFALPLTCIGRIVEGSPGAVVVSGVDVANIDGYDHFST